MLYKNKAEEYLKCKSSSIIIEIGNDLFLTSSYESKDIHIIDRKVK
jgi:hypothetical protein